jgi:hypothetical protein
LSFLSQREASSKVTGIGRVPLGETGTGKELIARAVHIRELQNVIKRAVILSKGPVLKVALSKSEGATGGVEPAEWILNSRGSGAPAYPGRSGANQLGFRRSKWRCRATKAAGTANQPTTSGLTLNRNLLRVLGGEIAPWPGISATNSYPRRSRAKLAPYELIISLFHPGGCPPRPTPVKNA